MKSMLKLMVRFSVTLGIAMVILLAGNLVLLISMTYKQIGNGSGWSDAETVAAELTLNTEGNPTGQEQYTLSETGRQVLENRGAWAVLVENGTGTVIWHSENLPENVPLSYSASEIASAVRGYIADYPTTSGAKGEDLLILGNPKDMYWKLLWNTFDYQMIQSVPRMFGIFLLVNLVVILLIYGVAVSGVLRSVRPIIRGIETLPEGGERPVREKGLLTSLAEAINRTARKMKEQETALAKKETARSNWIAGVSHDIRTPLSAVMGYAAELAANPTLPEEERRKADVICRQSMKMKNLVNDLNLSSKLEYNMQPLQMETFSLVGVLRRLAADVVDMDLDGRYPVVWKMCEEVADCRIQGDKELIRRAVNNILTNAQVHNPEGCQITIELTAEPSGGRVRIGIEDDGTGISKEQLQRLRETPHYMMSDGRTTEQRHGLGLLIVRQIAEAHGGEVEFDHGSQGGFRVNLYLPIC